MLFCFYICVCRWLSSIPYARIPAWQSRPNTHICAVTDVKPKQTNVQNNCKTQTMIVSYHMRHYMLNCAIKLLTICTANTASGINTESTVVIASMNVLARRSTESIIEKTAVTEFINYSMSITHQKQVTWCRHLSSVGWTMVTPHWLASLFIQFNDFSRDDCRCRDDLFNVALHSHHAVPASVALSESSRTN